MKWMIWAMVLAVTASCGKQHRTSHLPESYFEDLEAWKQSREKRLRASDGWVNLAGLYWLRPGDNSVGSAPGSDLVFPELCPPLMGTFTLEQNRVRFTPQTSGVLIDSLPAGESVVYDDRLPVFREMQWGKYEWFVIERAGHYGVRLRDLASSKVLQPLALEYFDWSDRWRVQAQFVPFDHPQHLTITNVTGQTFEEEYTGAFVFMVKGKKYSLLPSIGEESSFIMFSDATNGISTYGAGRYLYTGIPDEQGQVVLDFNLAYNPPCAYTPFATCPIPPRQNMLELSVEAGEKDFQYQAEE